jgi:lipid A 3-O-deacylase
MFYLQNAKLLATTNRAAKKYGLHAAGALLLIGTSLPIHAADDVTTWNVQWENDFFEEYTDQHYTSGLRFSATSQKAWGTLDSGFQDLATRLIPGMDDKCAKGSDWLYNISLGQNIYTPSNLYASNLITGDRPYAGWLYLNFGLLADRKRSNHPDASCRYRGFNPFPLYEISSNTVDTLELSVGVVGPAALAEQVQKGFHKIFDGVDPQGWDHQLHNEPAINLTFSRQNSWLTDLDHIDVISHWGGALGNVFTYANVGATLRVGQGLDSDYGPPRIRPGIPGSDFIKPGNRSQSFYFFVSAEGRAVARDIFLDGNTFRSSHSVDKYPLVADLQAGVVFRKGPVRISYTSTYRSKEFSGQPENSQFGALTVSASF